MIAIPASTQDLFDKLEAVRLVCHRLRATLSGWRRAGRDPADHARLDAELGTTDGERFQAHLEEIYAGNLTLGVAMTDGKGDRSRRPSQQANPDAYPRIVEGRPDGGPLLRGRCQASPAPRITPPPSDTEMVSDGME